MLASKLLCPNCVTYNLSINEMQQTILKHIWINVLYVYTHENITKVMTVHILSPPKLASVPLAVSPSLYVCLQATTDLAFCLSRLVYMF